MRYLALISLLLVSCVSSKKTVYTPLAEEPAIECEFVQKSWCLLRGSRLEEEKLGSNNSTIWKLAGDFWKDNPGLIIEPNSCREKKADEVRVLGEVKTTIFDGRSWTEAEISLFKSGECNLKLLIPSDGEDLYISRFLPTSIAICFEDKFCTENILVSFASPFYKK